MVTKFMNPETQEKLMNKAREPNVMKAITGATFLAPPTFLAVASKGELFVVGAVTGLGFAKKVYHWASDKVGKTTAQVATGATIIVPPVIAVNASTPFLVLVGAGVGAIAATKVWSVLKRPTQEETINSETNLL